MISTFHECYLENIELNFPNENYDHLKQENVTCHANCLAKYYHAHRTLKHNKPHDLRLIILDTRPLSNEIVLWLNQSKQHH